VERKAKMIVGTILKMCLLIGCCSIILIMILLGALTAFPNDVGIFLGMVLCGVSMLLIFNYILPIMFQDFITDWNEKEKKKVEERLDESKTGEAPINS